MRLRTTIACLVCILVAATTARAQRETETILAIQPQEQTAQWARAWWRKRHEEKLQEKKSLPRVDLLMIGDSITHGWETAGKTLWDQYYAPRHALNIGFSGDRTEHVLWRLQHGAVDGIAPRLAVIMIGTNNTGHRQDRPEHTAAGVRAILDELQTRLPQTKCLLLAIFPRGATKDDPLRAINDATNALISQFADGQRVVYLDLNTQFLQADATLAKTIMPDLLHPNEEGYAIWARSMEPTVKTLLGERN